MSASTEARCQVPLFRDLEAALTELYNDGAIETFMKKHLQHFMDYAALDPDDAYDECKREQKLEFTQAYREYQQLYQERLIKFLDSKGITEADFAALCEAALSGDSEADGGHREFIEILLASFEYPRFMRLMIGAARKLMAGQ
jgi:hypothetical protein